MLEQVEKAQEMVENFYFETSRRLAQEHVSIYEGFCRALAKEVNLQWPENDS